VKASKRQIFYSNKFLHSFKKLPLDLQTKAFERERIFKENIFDSRLDTHKLHGKLKEIWAFSVTGNFRIFFHFVKSGVLFLDIDDHDFYK